MEARLVRGACPHDCPDTCAMHVTVEDGRATTVAGDPDHPITVGFLCGKVSNYLDRVYSDERILHPLVREHGELRRASWDEALDLVADRLLRIGAEFGGEAILPYSYMGTQGLIQGNVMSARLMNRLGASSLERTICATAGYTGTLMAHGASPEVDPELWPHARYLLVWGWNPLSTAPHLWRKLLDARKQGARLVVVDPFRSRTARVADEHLRPLPGTDAALAIGMMKAIVDARLQDEDWCRAHADGYDELLAELNRTSVAECGAHRPIMGGRGGRPPDEPHAPPVKALVCWNPNPAAIAPDQERVLEGLRRGDLFTVVLEQFMTDTAAHADVILPATTQLEHADVLFSWGHHYLTWNEPAIEPLGEAKPNTEIFRLLAQHLGLDDPCFEDTDAQLVDALLEGFPENGLRERGWTKVDLGQGDTPHAEGGFGTDTGRVMLHARYEPPAEVADDALAERFPLALVTPKTHLFLNSTFANQQRQHSAQPHPEVVVSPEDAERRGIADGAVVRVFNDRGAFSCRARVSDDARPGVLVAPMGWWNSDYPDGRSAQATTPQLLTDEGAAPTFNDNRVEREAVSADQVVVLLRQQDAPHGLVEAPPRDAAAPDGP